MAKKWDSDATSSEKMLLLFATLLFNKRPFSLSELSSPACLNASKATTLRLLNRLENTKFGILKREKRGRESWYSLEHNQVSAIMPNPEGIAQLALCRDLVFHLLPDKMRDETAQTIAALSGRTTNVTPLPAVSLVKGQIDYAPFKNTFSMLERAIREKIVCRIIYRAPGNAKARVHIFAPLRLLASQECLYIEGWLLKEDNPDKRKHTDPVRLALQRFQACELTEYSSSRLPSLPLVQTDLLGIMEYEPFTAKIWFAASAASFVEERIWSREQKLQKQQDGSVILTVLMANYNEALSWVLGFGKKAIVQEPQWFAKEVRRELREATRNYQKHKIKKISTSRKENPGTIEDL